MARIFWQVENPDPAAEPGSRICNFGWHLLDGNRVHRRPMERPDGLLMVTVRGTPRIRHGARWFSARRGSVSLYLVGEEQDYGSEDRWEAFWFHFMPSPSLLRILAEYGHAGGHTWNDAVDEHDLEVLGEMLGYERLPEPLRFYRAAAMADHLVFRCLVDPPGTRAKPRHSRLTDIVEYIRANPVRRHTVAALARMAGLSESRFAHLFRREHGMAVHEYVQRCRMERAQHLLRATDLTGAEIAVELGYQSPYAFYHAFKKATGVGPGGFRARQPGRQQD
jgi:AraC-like DNA-binding protein